MAECHPDKRQRRGRGWQSAILRPSGDRGTPPIAKRRGVQCVRWGTPCDFRKILGENDMTALLFSYRDRDEAHKKLEEIRSKEGPESKAECRENPNELEPYQVWSGPVS